MLNYALQKEQKNPFLCFRYSSHYPPPAHQLLIIHCEQTSDLYRCSNSARELTKTPSSSSWPMVTRNYSDKSPYFTFFITSAIFLCNHQGLWAWLLLTLSSSSTASFLKNKVRNFWFAEILSLMQRFLVDLASQPKRSSMQIFLGRLLCLHCMRFTSMLPQSNHLLICRIIKSHTVVEFTSVIHDRIEELLHNELCTLSHTLLQILYFQVSVFFAL